MSEANMTRRAAPIAVITEAKRAQEVQRNVLDEPKWDARVQPNEIGVAVKDGIVILTGLGGWLYEEVGAEEAAHRVKGVRAVANDIAVRLPTMAERSDAAIAGAVTRAIEWDAMVPTDKVKLTVSNGWVTLQGAVEWQFEKERPSARRAGSPASAGSPTSSACSPQALTSDLKHRIEAALLGDAQTDARRIQVEVNGSTSRCAGQ
jgi:osmotically-inducible protein OsmY